MPEHPILPAGTPVRITTIEPAAHDEPWADQLPGLVGRIMAYCTTYPEYRCYRVQVEPFGTLPLFDDEFQPVD